MAKIKITSDKLSKYNDSQEPPQPPQPPEPPKEKQKPTEGGIPMYPPPKQKSEQEIKDIIDSHDSHTREFDDENESKKADEISEEDISELMDEKRKQIAKRDKSDAKSIEEIKELAELMDSGNSDGKHDDTKNKADQSVKLAISPVPWKNLLNRLITKNITADETTTYAKQHILSSGSTALSVDAGAASIKPAEVQQIEQKQKLIFVLDNSGSMNDVIGVVQGQIVNLIKQYAGNMEDSFYVVKFSDKPEGYRCSINAKKSVVVHLDEIFNNVVTPFDNHALDLHYVFTHTIGGGTQLTPHLANAIIKASKEENTVIMVSDSDILSGENLQQLKHILVSATNSSVGLVFSASNVYSAFVNSGFGNKYKNIVSYVNKKEQ